MLTVLSDLHFQEDPHFKDRNLEPRAFRILFEQLSRVARAKDAKELIVVLNGDIFDHMRNPRWLDPDDEGFEVRPYAECDIREGQTLPEKPEQRAWEIHKAIEADPRVKPCVDLLQAMAEGLSGGRFRSNDGDDQPQGAANGGTTGAHHLRNVLVGSMNSSPKRIGG